jgi:hypothetical protein
VHARSSHATTASFSGPSGSAEIVTKGMFRSRRTGSAASPVIGSITMTPSSGTRSQTKSLDSGGATTSAQSFDTATSVAATISSVKYPKSPKPTPGSFGSEGITAIRPVLPDTRLRAAGLGR